MTPPPKPFAWWNLKNFTATREPPEESAMKLFTYEQLEEARREGMEAGFNDGLVMAKLALLEMDECEEMSHGGCSCSTIKPAIEKIDEIRSAAKEKAK